MKIQKDLVNIITSEIPKSGVLWGLHFANTLIEIGYQQMKTDQCVLKKKINGKTTYICVYVDDLLISTDDENERTNLLKSLELKYGKVKHNEGPLITYRGLEIHQPKDGIKVTQELYAKQIVKQSKVKGTAPTPCTDSHQKILKGDNKPAINPSWYGKIVV